MAAVVSLVLSGASILMGAASATRISGAGVLTLLALPALAIATMGAALNVAKNVVRSMLLVPLAAIVMSVYAVAVGSDPTGLGPSVSATALLGLLLAAVALDPAIRVQRWALLVAIVVALVLIGPALLWVGSGDAATSAGLRIGATVALIVALYQRVVSSMADAEPLFGNLQKWLLWLLFGALLTPTVVHAFAIALVGSDPESPQLTLGLALSTALIGLTLLWAIRKLIATQSKLEGLLSSLDDLPITEVDGAGVIRRWSSGAEQLYGWTAEQAIGRNRRELLRTSERLEDVEHELGIHGAALDEVRRDGAVIHTVKRRVDVPELDRSMLVSIDVTAFVEAERRLTDTEARLLHAAEAHSIAIFDWDVTTGMLNWFGNTETFIGSQEGMMPDYAAWAAMVDAEDLERIERRVDAVRWSKADRFSFSYRLNLPSGEVRTIEGSARCFFDSEGELVRTVGVNVDVSRHIDRDTRLAAGEAQLRTVLETVPDAMIVIDDAGTVLSFSRAAELLFGYASKDVVGRNVSMLTPDHHRAAHDGYLRRYLQTGERRVIGRARALTAIHADGHEIPIELRVGEALFNDQRVFTGFIRDVSERLVNEQRLGALRDELNHYGRLSAMGEMAAGLAHEINQPLAAIANYMAAAETILQRNGDKQRVMQSLAAAGEQALRAGEVIRRLRDFVAKRETNPRLEPVEAVIREATALVMVGHERLNIDLDYRLSEAARYMFADRIQVQQVLVNLLRNSLDALRAEHHLHRRIVIESRAVSGSSLEIEVSDTGPGISDFVLKQLYEPFTSTKGEAGMGIGLSICRNIIEAHGGTMRAANRPNGGASFCFTLPRVAMEDVAA